MTHKIGEMFMLGFRTPEIPEWLHSFASEFGLGGVILFDYDVTIKKYERNIFDKAQVKKLCKEIHTLPSRPLIYVDQEGGKVRRLKDKYGFAPLPSAKQMGTMSKADRLAALKPAYAEMKEVGIDVNLAPVIDLDFNPTSPDIGSAERSFSADVKVVEECVKQIAEVANANGIQLCLKHFPGTGAARANPHDDLMDLSKYTSDDQVNIFRTLLPMVPMALFSHGLVNQWEKNTPVCLSKYAVNMFRGWDPDAVVLTDDLQMQGVQKLMNTETACVRALEAGADVILLGHNMLDEQAKSVQFARKVANAVDVRILNAKSESELESAFADLQGQRIGALVVSGGYVCRRKAGLMQRLWAVKRCVKVRPRGSMAMTHGDEAIRYRRAMKSSDDRKRKYFALMERYNQLGRLLPTPGDLDTDDAAAVAEARLILAEMNATQAKMDALSKRRRQ